MGSKKRQRHDHHHRPQHRDQRSSQSSHHKRRRVSQDAPESDSLKAEKGILSYGNDSTQVGDQGWTVVKSKSSKSNSKKKSDGNSYPELRFHENYQSEIRLKDLRDLGLYVLADEVAPKWTAISNKNNVRKVVIVMVPGMDRKVFERVKKLLKQKAADAKNGSSEPNMEQPSLDPTTEHSDDRNDSILGTTGKANTEENEASKPSYSWLFDHVLPVKGPGDAKMSKVHSPLQALLLSQEADKKNPSNSGHSAERTPVSAFVHSADELREAEFPIHPASFTSKLDAELEAERRSKTGQSTDDGWIDSDVSVSQPEINKNATDFVSQGLTIYSVDCEMVQTSDGKNSLARASIISYPDGQLIMDEYVKPDLEITNYFTQYSGITAEILEGVTTTLQDVQQQIKKLLTPSTILLGHSLDSDLNALKLTHPFLVDTSLVYPHPRGLPLRSSLKYLANKYLKREIQMAGANGHNSVEDAQAVLDLIKLKCEKGPKWGTIEANGEPIFRRLKRNGRTSAMVEYGTPERGFGKDATHTIGCQNDDEVMKGLIRAVKGDSFYDFEIPSGGLDYVWGRFRALEFAQGWVTGSQAKSERTSTASDLNASESEAELAKLDNLALQTVDRMQQVYDALPPASLLIICSGTADIRPVMKLQAQQQLYRKEFKVKKWDELTIKWTDAEEQALRKACDDARAGWGICAIK